MRIDIHTHAFHPKIADKVVHQLQGHYGINAVGTGLVEDLLKRAAAADLDAVAVHTAATAPAQVIPANNWAIYLKKEQPSVIPFGTLHPDFEDNEQEFARLEKAGIHGIKLHPDFQGFRLDDPKLFPILEMLEGRFVCMVHVGDKKPPELNPSCPKKLARIHKDFPELAIIAAHMGGYQQWQWALEYLIGTDVFIDTSSSLAFIDDDTLKKIFSRHPRERILFGSDYPLFDPASELKVLERRLHLGSGDIEALLTNAESMLQEQHCLPQDSATPQ